MAAFRKFALFIAVATLSILLYIMASLWLINQTILRPEVIKKWANDSGLYTNIVPAAIEVIDNPDTETSIPFKDTLIIEAGKTAFDEALLRRTTEQLIDQISAWLRSSDGKLTINLDISDARAQLATGIGAVATTKLQQLPACGATLPTSFDAFNTTCLPKGIDPTLEGQRLANELTNNTSFLGTGIITNETLDLPDQTSDFYTAVPKMYQAYRTVLIVITVLVVAFSLVIIFFSTDRRKGIRRVARTYIIMAIILVSTAIFVPYLSRGYAPATTSTSDQAFVDKIIRPLIDQVEKSAVREHFIIAGVIGSIGIVLALYLFATRTKKQDNTAGDINERAFGDHPAVPAEPSTTPPKRAE
jgi:hypothetical protein